MANDTVVVIDVDVPVEPLDERVASEPLELLPGRERRRIDHPIEEQHPVEVVELVLDDTGRGKLELVRDRVAGGAHAFDGHLGQSFDRFLTIIDENRDTLDLDAARKTAAAVVREEIAHHQHKPHPALAKAEPEAESKLAKDFPPDSVLSVMHADPETI